MTPLKITLPLLAFLASTAPAHSWTAESGTRVEPRRDGTLQVFDKSFYGARGMWCGAADYATRVKGARGTDRIYVKEPLTRRTGGFTIFTFSPDGLTPVRPQSMSKTVYVPGANMSVQRAFSFCIQLRAPYNIFG